MKPILVLVGLSTACFFWEGGELESDVLVTEKKMKHEQLLQDTFLLHVSAQTQSRLTLLRLS